jgi:hypothetical protein
VSIGSADLLSNTGEPPVGRRQVAYAVSSISAASSAHARRIRPHRHRAGRTSMTSVGPCGGLITSKHGYSLNSPEEGALCAFCP